VKVDGVRVNIPSYLVEPGQNIEMKENVLTIPDVMELSESPPLVPEWLHRNNHGGQVIREPERSEIDQEINERLIVEFYSR
jgi:small subunit ribosomal protein S4